MPSSRRGNNAGPPNPKKKKRTQVSTSVTTPSEVEVSRQKKAEPAAASMAATTPETNGCEDNNTTTTTATLVTTPAAVANHTDNTPANPGGRERIVVAIKSTPGLGLGAKTSSRHSNKRHKKSSSSSGPAEDPSPQPPKKSSKERRATRNATNASSSPPPQPPVEKRTIKISMSNNSTPTIKKTEKVDKVNADKVASEKQASTSPSSSSTSPASSPPVAAAATPTTSTPTTKSTRSAATASTSVNTTAPANGTSSPRKKGLARIKITPTDTVRASKRPRLQYQPYQAPVSVGAQFPVFKSPPHKGGDDKIMVFQKGEFLAVRNENGGFYVCRTAQNVYKHSRRFRIQWLNSSGKDANVYSPDFYDATDFECVLTNLRMKRMEKNKYLLPDEERKRTMNILQRALNVESGMDKPDPHQVTVDGVDVSIVGKEEEEALIKKSLESKVASKTKAKVKKEDEPPPKKMKLSVEPAGKSEERVSTPASRKKISEKLKPNLEITVVEKDPTFETTIQVPFVSPTAHSKLLIRAVLMKDLKLLQSLIDDTQNVCSLSPARSLNVPYTPLNYAIRLENHQAIKLLLNAPKKKYASPPDIMIHEEHSGSYNHMMLGHAIRPITHARGSKEGNNALIKDSQYDMYAMLDEKDLVHALEDGVSLSTIKLLCKEAPYLERILYQNIIHAVRRGHHKLAGQLVEEALGKGGFGFNQLHKEVLLATTKQTLSPFKVVSVTKKATDNARITPLHCACVNPSTMALATLLGQNPEYTLADRDGWLPMHYAAVCKSTAPLELLISRGVSIEETNSQGNTPLHVACIAGRPKNVDILLSHAAILYDQTKTEENSFLLSQYDKYGVGGINRPNQKSFTPLHLAVQHGHTKVVGVLLESSAEIDKPTAAAQEKLAPLMLAAQLGHFGIVKLLASHGATIEATDKRQRTALTHAVINGHAHVASYLLRLGADPNTADSSGNTLVHYACAYGWRFCLQLLIEAGAAPNTPNDWKLVPLAAAFMKGHIGLVNYLVEQPGVDINIGMNHETGMTLVMQTVRVEQLRQYESPINASMVERLRFLVDKLHMDCSKLDFSGNTALHYLVETETRYLHHITSRNRDEEEAAKALTPPLDDDDGQLENLTAQEPLERVLEEMKAEHNTSLEQVVHILLKNGCKPSIKNDEGESAFSLAIKNGCLSLVKVFLNGGCALSYTVNTATGDTILHYLVAQVAEVELESVRQAILQANCPVSPEDPTTILHKMANHYNKEGFTPLLLSLHTYTAAKLKPQAKEQLLNYIKFLLEELSADFTYPLKNNKDQVVGSALHLAVKDHSGALAQILLAKHPPLDPLDLESRTPLVAAICSGNVEVAELLIQSGANLSVKSPRDDSMPPLLLACRQEGMNRVINLLIQNKAPLHVSNPKNGNTALHYLVSQTKKDAETVKLVKSLLLNVDVNVTNHQQQSPLHFCVQKSSGGTDAYYGVEEVLLDNKARTEALDFLNRTPLHYAFLHEKEEEESRDPIELVSLLANSMNHQALAIQDVNGQTPLHLAAACGATVSVMHLMQKGNSLEMKDKDGNTALGLAVLNGHQSTALMLLQKEANCVADLVKVHKPLQETGPQTWLWEHLIQPTPPPTKITVLQEAVRQDWQSILYIMLDRLEALGKGYTVAIEAALQTASYHLALKLISRIKHNWTLYSEKQSMMHILARHAPAAQSASDTQLRVASALMEKGVPLMARDEHGCSSLTYAAINWNHILFNFLTEKVGIASAAQADPDKSLRTPLSAFFWKLGAGELSEEVQKCCEALLTQGANPNLLTQFPCRESPYPGVRCVETQELHQEGASAPRLSPLLVAIYRQNYGVVRLLLQQGADVNFADDLQRTPLMHAARLHDLKMVKLLLNYQYCFEKDILDNHGSLSTFKQTSPADLSRRDVHGYTVVHHAICPSVDFAYHHTALVNFLVQVGAPLDIPNNDGDTPLQMALNAKASSMVELLYDWMNVSQDQRTLPPRSPPPPVNGPPLDPPSWDLREDYSQQRSQMEGSTEDSTPATALPDPCSKLHSNGEVIYDKEKNIPYDILLTCVDIRYRQYGLYNFYKMQVLKQKDKNLALLFTRWGRVGDTGQFQKTPFPTIDSAVAEFCKIFKSKTGNSWDGVRNFKAMPKKYRLVSLDKRLPVLRKPLVLQKLPNDVPSQLPPPLCQLFQKLVEVHIRPHPWDHMGGSRNNNNAAADIAFGRLTHETLDKAEEILSQIRALVEEDSQSKKESFSKDPDVARVNKMVELSEDLYHLVTVHGYEFERLEPLLNSYQVSAMTRQLGDLRHLGYAAELVLGSLRHVGQLSPLDYVYRSLGCRVEPLAPHAPDAQMVMQYLHHTAGQKPPRIAAIYRLGSTQPPSQAPAGQAMMLWHGTATQHVLAILHRGLQPSPLGSRISGVSFGKGIYLSNMFKKSYHYCSPGDSKFVFLCEVSLGTVKEYSETSSEKEGENDDGKDFDTLKVVGEWGPDPIFTVSYQGVLWPMGSSQAAPSPVYWLDHSEFVVRSPQQVQLRYLVQLSSCTAAATTTQH